MEKQFERYGVHFTFEVDGEDFSSGKIKGSGVLTDGDHTVTGEIRIEYLTNVTDPVPRWNVSIPKGQGHRDSSNKGFLPKTENLDPELFTDAPMSRCAELLKRALDEEMQYARKIGEERSRQARFAKRIWDALDDTNPSETG